MSLPFSRSLSVRFGRCARHGHNVAFTRSLSPNSASPSDSTGSRFCAGWRRCQCDDARDRSAHALEVTQRRAHNDGLAVRCRPRCSQATSWFPRTPTARRTAISCGRPRRSRNARSWQRMTSGSTSSGRHSPHALCARVDLCDGADVDGAHRSGEHDALFEA
jgi:hypothetical protein